MSNTSLPHNPLSDNSRENNGSFSGVNIITPLSLYEDTQNYIENREIYKTQLKLLEESTSQEDCEIIYQFLIECVKVTSQEVFEIEYLNIINSLSQNISNKLKQKFQILISQKINIFNLETLNLLSLQFIIFFTQCIYALNPKRQSGYYILIKVLIEKMYSVFTHNDNYISLEKLKENINETIDDYDNYIIFKNEYEGVEKNHFYPLLKLKNPCGLKQLRNARIITLLGVMTLEEIIESELNNIHYIGFSYKEEWADGIYSTPFEFCDHDLVHSINSINFDIEEKEFCNYVKNNIQDKKIKDFIYLIIFVIIHENYNFLYKKLSESKSSFDNIKINNIVFNGNDDSIFNKRYKNQHNLGGLINSNINIIFENSDEGKEERKKYLQQALENFHNVYNEFLQKKSNNNRTNGGKRKTKKNKNKKRKSKKSKNPV